MQQILLRAYAALRHPLHTKAAMFIRLPWHWLGGALQELWKKVGAKVDVKNYRDITLVEHEARPLSQFIRSVMKYAVGSFTPAGQCGSGLSSGSTDTCHLFVTQSFCLARTLRLSCGMLYVDLVSAFALVLRRIIHPQLP